MTVWRHLWDRPNALSRQVAARTRGPLLNKRVGMGCVARFLRPRRRSAPQESSINHHPAPIAAPGPTLGSRLLSSFGGLQSAASEWVRFSTEVSEPLGLLPKQARESWHFVFELRYSGFLGLPRHSRALQPLLVLILS